MRQFAGLLLVTALVGGCGEGTGIQIPEGDAKLRVVNASPDATALQVMIGTRNFSTAAFPDATSYGDAPTGVRQLQVRTSTGGNTLLTSTVGLQVDQKYTFIILNRLQSLQGFLLTDDAGNPRNGAALLRFVNALQTAGNVDLYLTTANADIQTATPALTNLAFRQGSEYLDTATGTYRLRATTSGTKTVIMDVPAVTIAAGQIRTIVVVEKAGGGTPYSVLLLED